MSRSITKSKESSKSHEILPVEKVKNEVEGEKCVESVDNKVAGENRVEPVDDCQWHLPSLAKRRSFERAITRSFPIPGGVA